MPQILWNHLRLVLHRIQYLRHPFIPSHLTIQKHQVKRYPLHLTLHSLVHCLPLVHLRCLRQVRIMRLKVQVHLFLRLQMFLLLSSPHGLLWRHRVWFHLFQCRPLYLRLDLFQVQQHLQHLSLYSLQPRRLH